MEALGGGGGGFLRWNFSHRNSEPFKSKSSGSADASTAGAGSRFPLKQAATAGSLALTGDTIAQVVERWRKRKASDQHSLSRSEVSDKDVLWTDLLDHDWLRALRMTSYGFLLYGPGSYVWYRYLDRCMPKQTVQNVMMKVLLNQIVLGPCVIAVCFAWNSLWQGKLSQLPNKYQRDALLSLLYGFRFWIPVSALNFCGPTSSSCSFHVIGLHILELLFVINYEQVVHLINIFL